MATVKLNLLSDVGAHEEFGELTEAILGAIVSWGRDELGTAGVYAFILAVAELPQPGSAFDGDHPELILEERIIDRIVSQDADGHSAHVQLIYRLQRAAAAFDQSGGVSTIQLQTDVDSSGTAILTTNPDDATDKQIAPVDVFVAQIDQDYQTTEATDNPAAAALVYLNKTNNAAFRDQLAGTWRVSAVSWEPADMSASPKTWHFTWQLSHQPDGWNPTVVFVNRDTGKIPSNATRTTVTWYTQVNFAAKFT
jgi:hypothetical protein